MSETKDIDIAIFGATGFTGQLIVEYLSQNYVSQGIKVALAGRSADKLAALRDRLGMAAETPIIVADAEDGEALSSLAGRCRVLISAAGPYTLYGNAMIAACAEQGTDYVDLAGEPVWIRQKLDLHEDAARRSGARIVNCCGYDSIPSDLGMLLLQREGVQRFGSTFSRVKGRVEAVEGEPSGGTVMTIQTSAMAAMKDPAIGALAMNPFALAPGFEGPKQPSGNKAVFDEELDSWSGPFVMAAINTKIVHRSNFLLGQRYGRELVYDEMMLTGPGEQGEEIANEIKLQDMVTGDDLPQPGDGPNADEREAGFFKMVYHGWTEQGEHAFVRVEGFQDPGYGSTSRMISESALCLLQDGIDTKGGFWTPASAMGETLMRRLSNKGVLRFEISVA